MSEAPTEEAATAVEEMPTPESEEQQPSGQLSPEQQATADETAGLTQLYSVTEMLRHSVTPAISDFTGIASASGFLASLQKWHAQGIVNGLVQNALGDTGLPYAWRLTHLGNFHGKAQAVTKTGPAITTLTPATASIAAAAGKPVNVTVAGTGIRGTQVVQVDGVRIPANYTGRTQTAAMGFVAKYSLPASPGTHQFSIFDGETGQTSANSAFTVTA